MAAEAVAAVEEEWRTRDMAMVAYLATKDINYIRMERNRRSCFWYFEDTDELRDEVDAFTQGDALVEPSTFNENFGRIKREMFEYLDSTG